MGIFMAYIGICIFRYVIGKLAFFLISGKKCGRGTFYFSDCRYTVPLWCQFQEQIGNFPFSFHIEPMDSGFSMF